MKKFIVYTRAIPGCCNKNSDVPNVVEVDGHMISAVEDPSVLFLPQGEFKFSISMPAFLQEMQEVKQADGTRKKIGVPTVYYSHSIFHSVEEALAVAENMIKEGFEFEVRKGRRESYTEEEFKTKCAEIQQIML